MLPSFIRHNPFLRIWFFFVFMCSGIIINCLQLLSALIVWPVSKRTYRQLNALLVECHWTEIFFMLQWWSSITLRLYAESEAVLGASMRI